MTEKALIIFARNPELGKCKTRLAKTLGDKSALDIYKYLLRHTASISHAVEADRFVFYSESITENDIWDNKIFNKKLQRGNNLGERMENAFKELLDSGYKKVLIIGSDLLDLNKNIIDKGFDALDDNDVVLGPAKDGGYYLLGMKTLLACVFRNKDWGTATVRRDTLKDLQNHNIGLLKELNDIDTFEDMKHYEELKRFYN